MIRTYSNPKIYKNFLVVKILSLIALVLAVLAVIPYAIILFKRHTEISLYQIVFCVFAILCPLNQLLTSIRALKTNSTDFQHINLKESNACIASESKFNNDFSNILAVVIVSLLLSPNIFVYIADGFLIHNCVLIKREWKENPPNFVKEQQDRNELKNAKIKHQKQELTNAQNLDQYIKLIEQCGIKFFITYYKQIKRLPLRDITITENYTSTEKEERLFAAKKIIDLGLTELALTHILDSYSDILDTAHIEQAKTLLSELQAN